MFLKDINKNDFIEYSINRINKSKNNNTYYYNYINTKRLEIVYHFLCGKNLKCINNNCSVYLGSEKISSITGGPRIKINELPELQKECLLHECFCICEYITRIITHEKEYINIVKNLYGQKIINELLAV